MSRSFWLLRGLKFLLFAVLFVAVAGYVTMSLWNWLVPALFHGPVVSFAQALGLFALSKILFGIGGPGRRHRHHHAGPPWARGREMWRQKMEARLATMTPEEREKYRERLRRCGMPWSRWADEPAAATTPAGNAG